MRQMGAKWGMCPCKAVLPWEQRKAFSVGFCAIYHLTQNKCSVIIPIRNKCSILEVQRWIALFYTWI